MALFGKTEIEQELEYKDRQYHALRNQVHKGAMRTRKNLETDMDFLDVELVEERERKRAMKWLRGK